MKKILIFGLIIGMCFSMLGCSSSGDTQEESDINGTISITTTVETDTNDDINTNVSAKVWEKRYYVDEFNQETNEWFVCNSQAFVGTFSNSATTDSQLKANIVVDESDVSIILFEYGRTQVKNTYSSVRWYNITMLDEAGVKHTLKGGMVSSNGDRIVLTENKDKLVSALKKGETVKIYIVQSDRTSTTYLFSADGDNFGELVY